MAITHLSLSNTVPVCKYCTIGSHKTLFHGPLLSHFGLHFGHPKNASAARWTSPVPWTPGKLSQRQERLNAAQKRLNPFKSVRQVPEVRRFQRSWGGVGVGVVDWTLEWSTVLKLKTHITWDSAVIR